MILDGQLLFTGTQPAPGSPLVYYDVLTSQTNSTNTIDLHILAPPGVPQLAAGQGARDLGIGDDPALKILVQCLSTFAGGTSIAVSLQGAPDAGGGTNTPGAFVTWWTSPVYPLASLVAGARLMDMDMPRPPAGVPVPRFLRLGYTLVGTFSGGSNLLGTIVLDRFDQMYNASLNQVPGGYPPGVVVPN